MNPLKSKVKLAGLLIILGMVAGILSISPAIDSPAYLTGAAAGSNRVIISALFQFVLFITYLGFVLLLYPVLKRYNKSLALGFLSFRITAGVILILGIVILLSILALSQEFVKSPSENSMVFEALGNVLKITRDYINHVFMVLTLGMGNLMLYTLLFKAKLIPGWISVWGISGTVLSVLASVLLLFKIVDVITPEYLVLNVPTALFEIVFGFWLIFKGLNLRDKSAEAV